MRTFNADSIHAGMASLSRRPVLSAMIAYLLGCCVAAGLATLVWRESSRRPASSVGEQHYVIRVFQTVVPREKLIPDFITRLSSTQV
jgi:hypothetical protein